MNARQLCDCVSIYRLGMGTVKMETVAFTGNTMMLRRLGNGKEIIDGKGGFWKVPMCDRSLTGSFYDRLLPKRADTWGSKRGHTKVAFDNFMLLGAPSFKTLQDLKSFRDIYNTLRFPSKEIEKAYEMICIGRLLSCVRGDDIDRKRANFGSIDFDELDPKIRAVVKCRLDSMDGIHLYDCLCTYELALGPFKMENKLYRGNNKMLELLGDGRYSVMDGVWQVPINEDWKDWKGMYQREFPLDQAKYENYLTADWKKKYEQELEKKPKTCADMTRSFTTTF